MSKWLYGASVQGIQEFIFRTNKLKEIVGGSEIVKKICESMFYDVSGVKSDDQGLILNTAGNIKCIFDNEEKLKVTVKNFPKCVMTDAPGITISQAVVKIENNDIAGALQKLEVKLKVQRNQPSVPIETGYMVTERARRKLF